MGSKARHAKELLPIILKNRQPEQWYVEPFVGGANMIDKVTGNRIANDFNYYLIELLKKMSEGVDWIPTEVSEEQYKLAQNNKDKFPAWSIGYCGFCLSYAGKWFGGWRRDSLGKRNYVMEAYRNTLKQAPLLKGINFYCGSYAELQIPQNSIIYCDPPYEGTTKYKDDFNHNEFWQWCRNKHDEGNQIFISEYNAPDDFICIWEKTVNNTLTADTGSKQGVEKLFTLS